MTMTLTTMVLPLAYTILSLLALSFVEIPLSVAGLEGKRAYCLKDMVKMMVREKVECAAVAKYSPNATTFPGASRETTSSLHCRV